MKNVFLFLVMLLIAISTYGVDISGSTAASGMQGEEYQKVCIDQTVSIGIDALTIDLSGGYDIDLELEEKAWDYEVGASYSLAYFTFSSSICGEKDLELNENSSAIDFAYGDVGANVTVLLSFDETVDQFQGAEFYAFYKPGPVEVTVGYLFTDDGAEVAGEAPDEPLNGGLYAKLKVSY